MADVHKKTNKKKTNILDRHLEKIQKEQVSFSEAWPGITFLALLYLICLFIEAPDSFRGIIAQLESIITIILVVRFPRKGLLVGVVLIAINIIFMSVIVVTAHNFDAITGIVVALLNLISIVIIGTLVNLRFAEMKRFNAELEQRVQERTKELADANREMEAFSYSVSHDLRSPLRTINGFCKIILDDYGHQMDADFMGYFHKIRAASQHMGDLIDDLLKLSRISRTQLNLVEVNLSEEIQEIFNSLQSLEPEREITLSMPKEIIVAADKDLITIALHNLLQNAWKFTGKRKNAQIEIGSYTEQDDKVIYIKDNGAGFDMTYAGKLFTAFQRLHSGAEYEGTGIGLAITQRIISRHGGRVWAEGVTDQGATFYFLLPDQRK